MSMSCAIYARYSSDRQSERSAEDQIRLCRAKAKDLGFDVVECYSDLAISGDSTIRRPVFQQMVEDAKSGKFQIVIAEALDRLSRDLGHTDGFYKTLRYHGVKIFTLAEGEITTMHIGLKGTMNEMFLTDLAAKTKRGQIGCVEAGTIPGGLTYGYHMVRAFTDRGEPVKGLREIDPEQSAVVIRIFEYYAQGMSGRQIAGILNNEGIPSPRGGVWNASTINGNRGRGNGILNNELYFGKIVYNRQTFIKDPMTGKRQARPNPPHEWITKDVPELRIVTEDLWQRTRDVRAAYSSISTAKTKRPKKLLSGLIKCGCCNSNYIVVVKDRYGCSGFKERGICKNNHTISSKLLEDAVFDGLSKHLVQPEYLKEFIEEFHRELSKARKAEISRHSQLQQELTNVEAKIGNIMDAIEQGLVDDQLKSRLKSNQDRRTLLQAEIRQAPQTDVIEFHPNLAAMYEQKIGQLYALLNLGTDERQNAMNIIRGLVESIVLHPGKRKGDMDIEIHGRLAEILSVTTSSFSTKTPCRESMVAGAGFAQLPTYHEALISARWKLAA